MFGLALKKDTGDTREPATIDAAKHLLDEGASPSIHDPKASREQILRDINPSINDNINRHDDTRSPEVKKSPHEAPNKAHAIAARTEWDESKDHDHSKIHEKMEKPAFIPDGRKIMDH